MAGRHGPRTSTRGSAHPGNDAARTSSSGPCRKNHRCAKGVGEAGTLGSTPSIVNAAVDALSEFGVTHIDMMLRPEKLWRIIQGGRA